MTAVDDRRAVAREVHVEDDRETNVLMRWVSDKTSTDWQALGACQGEDPKIFFPVKKIIDITLEDGTVDVEEVEDDYPTDEAKSICGFCRVKDICLSAAINDPQLVGTWGGTSTYQREQLRRRRARKSCPGCSSSVIIESGTTQMQATTTQMCLSCGVSWPA